MNEDAQALIAEINGSISVANKRQNGLLKLSVFLENCLTIQQRSLLENNCLFWIKTLLQIFENYPIGLHAKLAHYCFYLLIQSSKKLSAELNRVISTTLIEKSVNLLVSSNDALTKNALICLNELISCYKASCSQFRQKIENFVVSKLDHQSQDVMEWAAICYAKLPFLQKNTNNSDIWYFYFKNVLKNANQILNELFEDHESSSGLNETIENDLNTSTSFSSKTLFNRMSKQSDNLESYFSTTLRQFKSCCLMLGNLFEPLNEQTVIKVRALEIIKFLKRLFSVDIKKTTNDSRINLESKYLCQILSDMFNATFVFCKKFFLLLKTNLSVYSLFISQMFASFSLNINEKILFKSVGLYYECLTEWMNTNGSNSGMHKYAKTLIETLLAQPTLTEFVHLLNQKLVESKQTASKEMQMKSESNQFLSSKMFICSYQIQMQNEIYVSALKCLRTFVHYFNKHLKYDTFYKIQQTIIEILLSVQYNVDCHKPYDQAKCRLELYKNLFELCLTENSHLFAPLSSSIALFRAGLDDNSIEIKSFAQHSLNSLRPFVNPIQPLFIKEYHMESTVSNDSNRPNESNFLTQLQHQPKLNVELNQSQQQLLSFLSNSNGVKFVNHSDSMIVETSMSLPIVNTNGQTSSSESKNMKKRSLNQEVNEQKEEVNSNKRLQIDNNLTNGNNLSLNQENRSMHKASYEEDDEIEKQADADDDEDEEEEIFDDSENYEDLDEDEEEDEHEDDDEEEEEEDEEDEEEEMEEDEEIEPLKKKEERPMETAKANGVQNTSKQNIMNKANGSADENTEFTEDDDDIQEIDEVESEVEDSEEDFDEEGEDDDVDEQDEASKESDNKVEKTICEQNDNQFANKENSAESVDSESKSISSQSQNMQSSQVANTESIVAESKLEETNYTENNSNQNASLSMLESSTNLSSQLKEASVQDASLSQNNKENAEEEFDENKYMEMCSTLNTDAVLVENNPNVTLNNNNLDNNNA